MYVFSHHREQKNDVAAVNGHQDKTETEYQAKMQLTNDTETRRPRVASHGRRAPASTQMRQNSGVSSSHRRHKAVEDEQRPDFFSLSQ